MYANSSAPVVSALVLGLLTAISPCPMATNITAIGFIGKDIGNRNRVFYNGLLYTLGRTVAYTLLAFILYLGADQLKISGVFQLYGEKIIGPLLLIIGIFMLGLIKLNFPAFNRITERFKNRSKFNYWDVFLLGVIFALAFCPYSGVLYFGMLIPLTVSTSGLHLPVVFAVATGIPVILFAWLIAFSLTGVGNLYKRIKSFEYWFRKVVAVLFIGIGIYYIVTVWFKL
ncbi:MAG: aromatic aminobenezylarsenical efflux permease ArsG family transporter [Anaerolineales bacterium]|nr:aromatic aminobenezylarsenical efflux permease ArsG family transporter [Anaerolineales bacterium]